MILVAFLSGLILFVYLLFFLTLFMQRKSGRDERKQPVPVSIIIVGRNEEQNVNLLLDSIESLDYPHHLLELLFFDDNSEDRTLSLIRTRIDTMGIAASWYSGKCLGVEGKKAGLAVLASKAHNDWLLFTDADVVVPSDWVSSMVNSTARKGVRMVCGPVAFESPKTVLDKLYSLEFAALVQTSLMSIQRRFPFMCNAANMMVGRDEYLKNCTNLGEALSSGDDVYLLKSISENYGVESIAPNFEAMVVTSPPSSLNAFFNQRIRWAGKTSKLFFARSLFVSVVVFCTSLSMLIMLVISIYNANFFFFGAMFLIKWMIDMMVLKKYAQIQSLFEGWRRYSLLLSLIYPVYVVSIAVLSLKRSYLWKGRMVK